MSDRPDWEAIQREYEAGGIAYRVLAAKYGVNPATLYSRSRKWHQASSIKHQAEENQASSINQNITPIHALRLMPSPSPANAVAGANLGLEDLLELMQKNKGQMGYDDHVKASNAMERYNKIIINAPPDEEQDEEQDDLSGFTEEEARTYAELQERAKRRA